MQLDTHVTNIPAIVDLLIHEHEDNDIPSPGIQVHIDGGANCNFYIHINSSYPGGTSLFCQPLPNQHGYILYRTSHNSIVATIDDNIHFYYTDRSYRDLLSSRYVDPSSCPQLPYTLWSIVVPLFNISTTHLHITTHIW